MDADRVDSTQALGLDQIALNAGHDCPNVTKGDAGKTETPQQRHWDAKDGRQHTVAPVLGDGEGGVAGLPHSIHTVGAIRLGYHILKIHLHNIFIDLLRVPVDQINLLGVTIFQDFLLIGAILVRHIGGLWPKTGQSGIDVMQKCPKEEK